LIDFVKPGGLIGQQPVYGLPRRVCSGIVSNVFIELLKANNAKKLIKKDDLFPNIGCKEAFLE